MTMESNIARDNISQLLEAGETFATISKHIGTLKTPLEAFYRGSGCDLESKQCDKLVKLVGEAE